MGVSDSRRRRCLSEEIFIVHTSANNINKKEKNDKVCVRTDLRL
jgi:hypothetical protein